MIKVDVLFPAYINATIGPCGTLRRLNNNKAYLENRGYELSIFTLDNAIVRSSEQTVPIDFTKGLNLRSKIKKWLSKTYLGFLMMDKHNISLSTKLLSYYLSLNRQADVVVFHESQTCGLFVPHKGDGQKVVCFFHSDGTRWGMQLSTYPFIKGSKWMKKRDSEIDRTLHSIDRYVFIAQMGQENFLRENTFVPRESTSFFHNGIDDYPIIKKEESINFKYRLCTVGSLSHRKGQYLIVEALHNIDARLLEQIHLTIYGAGSDYDFIQKQIKEYGLEAHITLYGNLPNREIHEKLSEHNIFLLMSNNEGLPISIIEAMRAGLPVISTRVSGIPEEVDERNGILINPDSDELSEVLSKIELYNWEEMGRQSRLRFENEFSFKKMLEGYCDMLDATIKQ